MTKPKVLIITTGGTIASKIDYVMGWSDNGDYCYNRTPLDWVEQALQAESIVSPLAEEIRDYHYHDTKVIFVEGENATVEKVQGLKLIVKKTIGR